MDRQQLSEMHDRLEMLRAQREQNGHEASAAKSIEPDGLKGTSLENAPDLGAAFDKGSGRDGLGPPQGLDSQQVQGTGSRNEMRPTPEIAEQADRERHANEMAKDDKAAQLDHYRSLAQDYQDRQSGMGLDRDTGRSMG
ncbi:MAG: hypothetical protein AAGB48_11450 [Planctomycetota bacterium]